MVERLTAVQNDNEQFFFYDGTSQRQSMVKSWDRVFQKVFAMAKPTIKGGHPHRFRDTFAVSLLLKGVSIEIVSKLGAVKAIRMYATLRRKADQEDRRAAMAARRAVRLLRGGRLKMSARDAARLLGLSHQRVHQLAQDEADHR